MLRLFLLTALAMLTVSCGAAVEQVLPTHDAHSKDAFDLWLANDEQGQRAIDFDKFEQFLTEQGAEDVLPAWQLLRTDANYSAKCDLGSFVMPPRSKWPAIVPTLRIIRDEIIPIVGRVEVNSAWRSDALNECINGASGSKHLAFSAVDLIAPESKDKRAMFAELCAMHAKVGARTKMGLGAYFNSWQPMRNRRGGFHIDAAGYRTWGFDYSRSSSACIAMAE